jgi:hypothetical protein
LTDIVDVCGVPGLYVTFPLTAVYYGLLLISHVLEKGVAAFDAEHRAYDDPAVPD